MRWRLCTFQEKRPTEERDALGNIKYQWVDKKTAEVRFSPFTVVQNALNGRLVSKVVQTFATKATFEEIEGCTRILITDGNVREIEEISDQCPRYTTGSVKVYQNESEV